MKDTDKVPAKLTLPDRTVTTGELAQYFGVSIRTIQRLSQSGVIVPVGRGRDGNTYKLIEAVQAYCAMLEELIEQRAAKDSGQDLKDDKLRAEIALKRSQGELHRLKSDITKGKYISLDDVKNDYLNFYRVLSRFALVIPKRVCGIITGYVDPIVSRSVEKDLQREINTLLRSFTVAGISPPDEGGKTKKP